MAILDKTKNNFVIDREEDKSIGLRLPLVLDNSSDALTKINWIHINCKFYSRENFYFF